MQLERQIVFFSACYHIPWEQLKHWIFVGLSHPRGHPDGTVDEYITNFLRDFDTAFPCIRYLLQVGRFKSVGPIDDDKCRCIPIPGGDGDELHVAERQ